MKSLLQFHQRNPNHQPVFQDMFKRLVDAVPEVKFELYSFKSTIKCKEMLEQDCWFENKVTKNSIIYQLQAAQWHLMIMI